MKLKKKIKSRSRQFKDMNGNFPSAHTTQWENNNLISYNRINNASRKHSFLPPSLPAVISTKRRLQIVVPNGLGRRRKGADTCGMGDQFM